MFERRKQRYLSSRFLFSLVTHQQLVLFVFRRKFKVTFGRILLAVFKDFIVLLSRCLVFSGGTLLLRAVFGFGANFFVLFSTSLLFSPVPKY